MRRTRVAVAAGTRSADGPAVAPPGTAGRDMGRKKTDAAPPTLTPQRASRLYKLLTLLGRGPQTRATLLRGLGIEVVPDPGNKYALADDLDEALSRLPFPDPGLNVRDAQQLAQGNTP